MYGVASLEQLNVEEYKRQHDTNVLGLLLVTKAALPLFPATGGSVINISSVASTLAPPATAVYSSTKGAVDTITRSLAKELGPRKIRVNAINPGLVITEGTKTAGIVDSDFEREAVASTPLGRAGQPEDIAPPVPSSPPRTRAGLPAKRFTSPAAPGSEHRPETGRRAGARLKTETEETPRPPPTKLYQRNFAES